MRLMAGMEMWSDTSAKKLPQGAAPPMQQHPAYGETCAALGTGLRRMELRRGGRLKATAQILLRRWPLLGRAALLSRGPVWSEGLAPADRAEALAALVRQLRADHRIVLLTPERGAGPDPLQGAGLLQMMTPGHVAWLALDVPEEGLRSRLHGKWRNGLARAERAGLRVVNGAMPHDPGHWLLAAEAAQAKARRYRRLPPDFTLAWKGESRLFVAEAAGRPVAGLLFLLHGPTATYHIGWTGEEGRRLGAHTLLMWRAILWLQGRGYRALDLESLDTERTPGLARFKLGTGAAPLALGSTWLSAPGAGLVARLTGEGGEPRTSELSIPHVPSRTTRVGCHSGSS